VRFRAASLLVYAGDLLGNMHKVPVSKLNPAGTNYVVANQSAGNGTALYQEGLRIRKHACRPSFRPVTAMAGMAFF
jgi:Tfp pilus tip-associated adhesin PilY1